MKLILMGTPDFVVPIFDKILGAHEIYAVFTRAPKPVGRKQVMTKTPVHIWAESKGISVYTSIKEIENVPKPDYIVVAAYGVILKDNVLGLAPCINIHPSLLPQYRGAAPITSTIMNGETETGVCVMKMAPEVDAGDIFMCERFLIGENDTTADVEKKIGEIAGPMVIEYLANPEKYPPVPQTGEPTFTKKITSDDSEIDWTKTPLEIHNLVRAIGGRTRINEIDVKILETRIKDGKLEIVQIQPAGKKPMSWNDFMNGQHGKCVIG